MIRRLGESIGVVVAVLCTIGIYGVVALTMIVLRGVGVICRLRSRLVEAVGSMKLFQRKT